MAPAHETLSRRAVALLLGAVVLVSALACAWAAWAEPNSRREWDERHAMDNVKSILTTGSLRPSFALYPSLAYLP
ncbi:MAG: hypothetical protein R3325_05205, partial [Thermoanaerobaculia bacterium]|nr:hypothetical protein [Thermoanaerobaculia bacterium]